MIHDGVIASGYIGGNNDVGNHLHRFCYGHGDGTGDGGGNGSSGVTRVGVTRCGIELMSPLTANRS